MPDGPQRHGPQHGPQADREERRHGAGRRKPHASTAWGLGDCNNKFVLLFVTKEGELVFMRKGELSEADKEAFYKVLDQYR